ncbi:MAG TPA: SDR family NAD(P)-dependent oxidoreductase [Dehalococcoidia bacterium]|nr:SDR family NAD(P)-dependent oxidoreductase [Dehalococcoidia bacterium]
MELRGRSLWLIGASSGIGAALAPELAAAGAMLAVSARREAELEEVADAAALRGVRPLVKPLDVTDLAAIERVYGELKAAWGRVEIVFYNAGTWAETRPDNFNTHQAVNQIDVNLQGLVRTVGTVMPDLVANRAGEIVGMASIAGYAGMPRGAAYSASKAGVNAFLQSMRMELRPYDVGVTTVNPGFVRSPLSDRNRFTMVFIMSAEDAARIIVKGMLAGETEIHFPKRLSWLMKGFTALPRPLYEMLAWRIMGGR